MARPPCCSRPTTATPSASRCSSRRATRPCHRDPHHLRGTAPEAPLRRALSPVAHAHTGPRPHPRVRTLTIRARLAAVHDGPGGRRARRRGRRRRHGADGGGRGGARGLRRGAARGQGGDGGGGGAAGGKCPSKAFESSARSASRELLKAMGSPNYPRAPSQQLGGMRRRSQLASPCAKDDVFPPSTSRTRTASRRCCSRREMATRAP